MFSRLRSPLEEMTCNIVNLCYGSSIKSSLEEMTSNYDLDEVVFFKDERRAWNKNYIIIKNKFDETKFTKIFFFKKE